MVKYIGINKLKDLVHKKGIEKFILELVSYLEHDFSRWAGFNKSPRHATYFGPSVIELMPASDKEFYGYKYVNGHPHNHRLGKLTIVGYGVLSQVVNGFPVLLSEMTLLTAIRTAATSVMASKVLANKNTKKLGIIGCGAQSEFQIIAHQAVYKLQEVYCFDLDQAAMDKVEHNLKSFPFKLVKCKSMDELLSYAPEILTLATVNFSKDGFLRPENLHQGLHINAIGGDAHGKYEVSAAVLQDVKLVIEFFEQTINEGEIKRFSSEEAHKLIYAELWEIVSGKKAGRVDDREVTMFDSVGFGLEDFSTLRYIYDQVKNDSSIESLDLIPQCVSNVKDLYGILN